MTEPGKAAEHTFRNISFGDPVMHTFSLQSSGGSDTIDRYSSVSRK